MGNHNSGRRPQPTNVLRMRGNPGKRPLNQNEPQPPAAGADFDEPPAELAGDAVGQAEWRRVAPILRQSRMVTNAERMALVALCGQWSRYLHAQGKVAEFGMVVTSASGRPVTNPYLQVSDKALEKCLKLWVELGLTPSSRSRLSALPDVPEPASKWAGSL